MRSRQVNDDSHFVLAKPMLILAVFSQANADSRSVLAKPMLILAASLPGRFLNSRLCWYKHSIFISFILSRHCLFCFLAENFLRIYEHLAAFVNLFVCTVFL